MKDKFVKSVRKKFKDRSNIGINKYGTTLERKDLSKKDWFIHLQEELMDATLYIEVLINKINENEQTKDNKGVK